MPKRNPYEFQADEVTEPPRSFFGILRRIGPGLILSASIVGSGELIATTTLGAEVGYTALWIITLSCLIKPAVQSELGRYVIATGETGAEGLDKVPGPRIAGVNWVVWAWVVMTFLSLFQVGAMFGGVAWVLNQLVPVISINVWVVLLLGITLAILLGGHYSRIEKLATVKVGLFTLLTFLCAVIMVRQPESFSLKDLVDGFKFDLPKDGLITAIAVFGITGVGASELFMYPYWCVEKGYARFAGPRAAGGNWEARARGWIRVMNVDIIASMVIYCVATAAFYMLGAGVLHKMGLVPKGMDMIPVLSNIYTQTLGPWGLWVFYAGAIATLYGTIFAATAGNSRALADTARLLGAFPRNDFTQRVKFINLFVWVALLVPVGLFFVFRSPVNMVKAGGVAQAAMLPILSIGALYLRHKRLPKDVAPGRISTVLLWVASITIIAAVGYSLGRELIAALSRAG
ncbi:MAG TPA: Nramp family divalent metal transporter [Opitutaceae bacterium]|nr:Nramp family divalent metal transporter [Opitutaceae bacterium]